MVFVHGLSNYISEEIAFCAVLKDKMGHSEEVNGISPKGPSEHYRAYTKCLLALFPFHFFLGVLNTSVEKGLVCSEADGSLL